MLARVLQTLQLSILAACSHVHLVPRTPVLARVLQTLQMSIHGGILHVHSFQGHPCSCAYFKHSKCPFRRHSCTSTRPKDTRARARTSNTPNVHSGGILHVPRPKDTRARARTSNTPNVHSRRHPARLLVPRTPVLARVLQTLQMSILGGILRTSDSPTCTRTRAPTARVPSLRDTPRTPARSQRLRRLATGARPARRLSNAPRTDCRRVPLADSNRGRNRRRNRRVARSILSISTASTRDLNRRDRSIDRSSVRVVTLETGETPARVAASAFPRRDARARCPREVRRRRRDARARERHRSIDRPARRATPRDARARTSTRERSR